MQIASHTLTIAGNNLSACIIAQIAAWQQIKTLHLTNAEHIKANQRYLLLNDNSINLIEHALGKGAITIWPIQKMHLLANNTSCVLEDSFIGHIISEQQLAQSLSTIPASPHLSKIETKLKAAKSEGGINLLCDSNEACYASDLVIGCSKNISELLGAQISKRPHNYILTANLEHSKPFANQVLQYFSPQAIFAILNFAPNRSHLIYSLTDSQATHPCISHQQVLNQICTHQPINNLLGNISLTQAIDKIPFADYRASGQVRNNCLLIAQAARNIHPLAGFGLNLALADVHEIICLLNRNQIQNSKKQYLATIKAINQQQIIREFFWTNLTRIFSTGKFPSQLALTLLSMYKKQLYPTIRALSSGAKDKKQKVKF